MLPEFDYRRNPKHQLYYRSMGKIFRVVCIAHTDEQANDFMRRVPNCGVIGVLGDAVVVAEIHGEKITTKR